MTDDEANSWPPPVRELLERTGLLAPAEPVTRVVCDRCERACDAEPFRLGRKEGGTDLVIGCPASGVLVLPPKALLRWTLDTAALARFCAGALALAGEAVELMPGRLWRLGERHRGRRVSTLYLAWGLATKTVDILPVSEQLRGNQPLLVLLAARPKSIHWPSPPGPIALLTEMLGFDGQKLTLTLPPDVDREVASEHFEEDVVPIRTPAGTSWERITLRVVADEEVEVDVAGCTFRRTAAEMGFLDHRSRTPEPSLLWGALLMLARGQGVLDWKSKGAGQKAKQYIHQIRLRLSRVFPDVEGNPIPDYKAERGWKTAFFIVDQRRP